MIRISLNLPLKYRLRVHLNKRRPSDVEDPLIPDIKVIMRSKKGNKFSRFFRHIFEHKNFKKLLGANLAIISGVALMGPKTNTAADQLADPTITNIPVVLTTEKGLQYPVDNIKVTQSYRLYHPGTDYDGITGDPIKAIMQGVVEAIEISKYGYGNAILLNHGGGVTSLYAHLSKINVKEKDIVSGGQVIGLMGKTGRATGDHLHFEIRENGIPVNPSVVFPK